MRWVLVVVRSKTLQYVLKTDSPNLILAKFSHYTIYYLYQIYSSLAGFSFGVMSLKDVLKICVPFTVSHAWEIGRRVIRATRKNEDPVRAILKEENRSLTIISGKVRHIIYTIRITLPITIVGNVGIF